MLSGRCARAGKPVREGVGALSMWAAFRDRPCAEGEDLTVADDACSGVAQEPGAFAEALNG
ncbi:hypothetical protein [Streptomyces clavifer]|uniref:hypothetical protein n=1 Tax=Streptomyces clavifer TaxID=68188 RepID=UPI0036B595B8